MKHSIFISYKRDNKHLAGRIYDFLNSKGFNPFLDEHNIGGGDWPEEIKRELGKAHYFLCLLTKESVAYLESLDDDKLLSSGKTEDIFYKEIAEAIKTNKTILVIKYGLGSQDIKIPPSIEVLKNKQAFDLNISNQSFFSDMETFLERYIIKKIQMKRMTA